MLHVQFLYHVSASLYTVVGTSIVDAPLFQDKDQLSSVSHIYKKAEATIESLLLKSTTK